MNLKQKLGKRIRNLRKMKGYSQEKLAEKTGLSVAFIGLAERGQECPSIKTTEKIANVLGVSLSELFRFRDGYMDKDIFSKEVIDDLRTISNMIHRILEKIENRTI